MIPEHVHEQVLELMEGFVEGADGICRSADMDFEVVGLLVFRARRLHRENEARQGKPRRVPIC